jgi:peptidoglycan/LPS O-acetylase OafA/YrhL
MFHIFWEVFGVVAPAFRNPATGFFLDGRLAVCVFFVLSGEALSSAYFAGNGDAATVRLAIKRYPRLAIPIVASCLIVFALDRAGLVYSREAAAIVRRGDWMGGWLPAPLTLAGVLRYGLADVFFSDDFARAVNPMLWTMRIELFGSFLVFALLLAWRRVPWPRALALALFLVTAATPIGAASYFSCFLAGAIFADWRAQGVFAAAGRYCRWAPLAAIATLGGVDGVLHCFGVEEAMPLFAVALALAVFCSPPLVSFFSCRLSRALGRISFPLYLIQFPVLLSLTSGLIVRAAPDGSLSLAAIWGISLASTVACVAAAIAFAPVEAAARGAGDRLVALVARARRRATADAPARS